MRRRSTASSTLASSPSAPARTEAVLVHAALVRYARRPFGAPAREKQMNESLRTQISELISQHRVVLFMKGNRRMPQCGFSAQVVRILDELLPSYETVDVLASP